MQEQLNRFEAIEVMLAPEGCKTVSSELTGPEDFVKVGWKLVKISCCFEWSEDVGYGVLGKRRQYGLKHCMACTIHTSMGQNLSEVITKVTSLTKSDYFLWEKEQVFVLLSRTHYAKDIFFVGDPKETSGALAELLCKWLQFGKFIFHLLDQFAAKNDEKIAVLNMALHPFHVADIELLQDSLGFVYILVSVKNHQSTYIGQTNNLVW